MRAGWYGKAPHRRQRWLCTPSNGDVPHRFTPVLTRQGAPHGFCLDCSTALELLIVDSMQFRVNSGSRAGLKFNMLAAVGSDDPPPARWRDAPKVLRLASFPTKSRASWVEFLSALEGTPRVVMSDADRALDQALRMVFPRAGNAPPDLRLSSGTSSA